VGRRQRGSTDAALASHSRAAAPPVEDVEESIAPFTVFRFYGPDKPLFDKSWT
jgi:hypothetical protein